MDMCFACADKGEELKGGHVGLYTEYREAGCCYEKVLEGCLSLFEMVYRYSIGNSSGLI